MWRHHGTRLHPNGIMRNDTAHSWIFYEYIMDLQYMSRSRSTVGDKNPPDSKS
jgi:hypothetical protein